MRRLRNVTMFAIAGVMLVLAAPTLAADVKSAPAKAKSKTVAAAVKTPAGPPWAQYKFGMNEEQTRKVLGSTLEPLKAPYRLGDYVGEFRGAPIQVTKGVAMRPLPLFHWKSGALEMLVLNMENAKGRDFVEVYQMLSKTYGASRSEHSQFQGPYQAFDVNWKSGGSSVALYFDEGGQLLTLELARTSTTTPEPYSEKPWLHASEWADLCACDMPLYYNRCGRSQRADDDDAQDDSLSQFSGRF